MTAVAATTDILELDAKSTDIAARTKRVRLRVQHSTLKIRARFTIRMAVRASEIFAVGFQRDLGRLAINTPADREKLVGIARTFGELAEGWRGIHSDLNGMDWLGLNQRTVDQIENLGLIFEDLAETAALSANEDFTNSLESDLAELGLLPVRQISRAPKFDRDLKAILKKHRTIGDVVDDQLNTIADVGPDPRDKPMAGWDRRPIYIRRIALDNTGKRGGLRMVFYCDDKSVAGLRLYVRSHPPDDLDLTNALKMAGL